MAHVLIVDDESGMRRSLARFVQEERHSVRMAENAVEAMAVLEAEPVDVVVSDIIMPKISGVQLLDQIHRKHPFVQVILITGEPTIETATTAVRQGAFDYIPKPIDKDKLCHTVAAAARLKKAEDDNRLHHETLEKLVEERTNQIREYSLRLEEIAKATRTFAVCRNVEELAPRVLQLLSRNMGADGGSLYLAEDDRLRLIHSLENDHPSRHIPLPPPPASVIGKIFIEKQAFLVRDIRSDSTFRTSSWTGYRNGSLLALPCMDNTNRIRAVITLHNKLAPPFTDQDLQLGTIIAAHSLEALQNIELGRSLRESEERYRELTERSKTGIFMHHGGRIEYLNNHLLSMLGYEAEDMERLLGRNIFEFVHPEDHSLVKESIASHMNSGQPREHYRLRLLDHSGGVVWTEISTSLAQTNDAPKMMGNLINITDQVIAERKLRQSEKEYRVLVENLADIIARHDRQGRFLFVNSTVRSAFGLDPRQLLGKNFTEIGFQPEPAQAFMDLIETVFETGQPAEREVEIQHFSTHFIFNVRGFPEFDETGTQESVLLISRDVTAQRKIEREYELLFKEMIDAFALHEMIFDKRGNPINYRFLAVNPAFEVMTGLRRENIIGKTVLEVLPSTEPVWIENYGRVVRTGIPMHFIQSSAELNRQFEVSAYRSTAGQFACIFVDATEKLQAERKLMESEKRFRAIFENAPIGVTLLDREKRPLLVNRSLQQMLGYSEEELYRLRFTEITHPEDREYDSFLFSELLSGKRDHIQNEKRYFHKDGSIIWGNVGISLIRDNDKESSYIIGMIEDITGKKQAGEEKEKLELELRQSQKMEAVGRLAGGIAHDFNNLLTSITGNTSLALMDLKSTDPFYTTMTEIGEAADRAASLTRQLLAFSRRQIIEPRVVNLNDVIRNLEKMLRRLIGEDIDFITHMDEDLPPVKVDPGQIEQIVINLAVNARDAMPQGGRLTLETSRICLDGPENDGKADRGGCAGTIHAQLTLSDTGIGMKDDVLERAFEPFFTTKPQGKGTGLGLSTVYGLVKLHNGDLELDSVYGKGTTFRIRFPATEERGTALQSKESTDQLPHGEETILIVEDEPNVRNIAVRILKKLGYTVLSAENGGEALLITEQAEEGDIDLLMTDVIMPKMNGPQLAERLKRISPNLRVLFTSGYTEKEIGQHGVLDESVNFISKPYSPQTLARKIRSVFQK